MNFSNYYKSFFGVLVFLLLSCSNDDSLDMPLEPFVVAFESLSANLSQINEAQDISLVYSEAAIQTGSVTLLLDVTNAVYGVDFITSPPINSNNLIIPILPTEIETAFLFTKLNQALDETVEIRFSIVSVDYPNAVIQGNTQFTINSSASLGRGFEPSVGGPNQPNQVYIDLSTESQTLIKRDSWDLGFYGGSDFRIGLNSSIYMAAAALESTDIDAVTQADVLEIQDQVAVGTFDPANIIYIDNPDGDINKTAIAPISSNDLENKVYLLNLGYEVGTETPAPGSIAIAGDARGWKKIRILKQDGAYLLQYADLNQSTHQEVLIEKDSNFNFSFFSFDTNSKLAVEPQLENWDVNFTVFTNVLTGAGSYGFSDGVLHNRKGGVKAYSILTDEIAYDDFSIENINTSAFLLDQRTIGSSWREVITQDKVLVDNIYYIIQDPNDNIYKLKFTALLSDSGERGFPEFKYKLVQ
tara:strand:+ start:2554 stop:3963 length:1410 start_codon:yes stop_codon:yes gene_type:complete